MAWITPIITWTPSPVGNADFNRIEGNTKYLREENKTINGTTTFTSLTTISSEGLTSSSSSIDLLKNTTIKTAGNDILELQQLGGNKALEFRSSTNWVANTDGGIFSIYNGLNEKVINIDGRNGVPTYFNTGSNYLFGSSTDNGTDLLQVGSNDDISVSMGYAKIGLASGGYSKTAYLGHSDFFNSTDYGFAQWADGGSHVNATAGKVVKILNNAVTLAEFGASSIELNKYTQINNSGNNSVILRTKNTSNISNGSRTGNRFDFKNATGIAGFIDYVIEPQTKTYGWGYGTDSGNLPINAGMSYCDITVSPSEINLYQDTTITGSLSVNSNNYILDHATASGEYGLEWTRTGTQRGRIALDYSASKLILQADGNIELRATSEDVVATFTNNGLFMSKGFNPTTAPTEGTWTTNQVIPRGIYNLKFLENGGGVAIKQNGSIIYTRQGSTTDQDWGGFVASDGVNTTVEVTGTGATVKYWRF